MGPKSISPPGYKCQAFKGSPLFGLHVPADFGRTVGEHRGGLTHLPGLAGQSCGGALGQGKSANWV